MAAGYNTSEKTSAGNNPFYDATGSLSRRFVYKMHAAFCQYDRMDQIEIIKILDEGYILGSFCFGIIKQ